MKKLLLLCLFPALLLLAAACNDDQSTSGGVDFDERAMLENYGNNLIFPAYADFQQRTESLQATINTFTENPTASTLAAAQQAVKESWLHWQDVSVWEFGPAEQLGLRKNINTFPISVPKIANALSSGTWDMNGLYSNEIRGFGALDYLLFSPEGDNSHILARYTGNENAATWKQFLKDVTTHLHVQATAVHTQWSPDGGNYLGTFITNTGNSRSSSLGLLVNQLNQGFEYIKTFKLGLPLGKVLTTNGQPIPEAVEAYHSGYSLELMQRNLKAVENTFRGTYASGDGPGLEEYLNAHHAAGNTGGEDVAAKIDAQFVKIYEAVNAIPAPLREAVTNNAEGSPASVAMKEMQNLVPLTKSRLSSILSVEITYVDNDGD